MSSSVFRRWSCQIIGASRLQYITRSSLPTCRPHAAKGSSCGNSTYSDLLASPYTKAVLTSANMIDLLAQFSHLVVALEITVRMAIKPGVPASNSPRLFPVLNSRAASRALAIGCYSVTLFVTTHLMLIIFPSSSLSMDSLDATRYTFILLNLFISLRVASITIF